MDEEKFNLSLRKFLKMVGITSQREIERRVREGLACERLHDGQRLAVRATVTLEQVGEVCTIEGEISLA